ncbi:DUF1799 domain-containing protein [Melaminivora sp.]|uniref:DUF1799 domain-containing protein n=1 Tax=Melaminivora sp. TaxID=1933032 RepID=UPI0028ACA98E|nr:DUF1799 domain-containing protein [Melaminivora sp.]
MQAFGAPQHEIDRVRAQIERAALPKTGDTFGVHADNQRVVAAFVSLRSQWSYAGMLAQRTGLQYAGVSAWLRESVRRTDHRREIFAGLQLMEHAVLAYDAEQRQKEEG